MRFFIDLRGISVSWDMGCQGVWLIDHFFSGNCCEKLVEPDFGVVFSTHESYAAKHVSKDLQVVVNTAKQGCVDGAQSIFLLVWHRLLNIIQSDWWSSCFSVVCSLIKWSRQESVMARGYNSVACVVPKEGLAGRMFLQHTPHIHECCDCE